MNLDKLLDIRSTLFLSDKYRLDLTWEKVVYEVKGVCMLYNAKFSGPALQYAERIKPNDFILLDFYRQYYTKVDTAYIVKFEWGEVIYNSNGSVSLKDAKLIHETELNKVPKFTNSDNIVIDTKGHDREDHDFNITYNAYVVNENFQLYNFLVN